MMNALERKRTRIKICGITNLADALHAISCGADALGFIFAGSPRYLDPVAARTIIRQLPPLIQTVGVFADQTPDEVLSIAQQAGIDTLQIHNNWDDCYHDVMPYHVIRGFRIGSGCDFRDCKDHQGNILMDSASRTVAGGSGESFEWQTIPESLRSRTILAGGLGPDNVAAAIATIHPYAVDASSRLETEPGKKDHAKVTAFCQAVHNTT